MAENEAPKPDETTRPEDFLVITWQDGPSSGPTGRVNGCDVDEVLRAAERRLLWHLDGPRMCQEDVHALDHVREAIRWLEYRRRLRGEQGLRGRDQPHQLTRLPR